MAYDPRAVKISIKRVASTYINKAEHRAFIKSYVRILEADSSQRSSRRPRGNAS